MTVFTKSYSSPVHIENTVMNMSKEDLKLPNAFKTYKNMEYDPIISGSTSFIKSVLNRPFYFKPHLRSTQRERQLVEALNRSLQDLEPYSLNRVMSNILSLVSYGTAIQEITYHRKDGFQVFKSFTPISLQQVNKFEFDNGYLKSIKLNPPDNDGMLVDVSKKPTSVPGDKVLMTSFQACPDNPLGKSILNGAYTTWKQKVTYAELGLIGASKSLSGVMKLEVPSEYLNSYFSDPTSDQALLVDNLIQQAELMGQGKSSFTIIPSDTTDGNSKLFSVDPIKGVDRQGFELEASINRCNRELYQALQASVLSLGQDNSGSGSYGLSSTKSVLLHQYLKGVHSTIASELRKVLKTAFQLNNLSDERLPTVEFEEISEPSFEEFVEAMKSLGMSGLVEPTGEMDYWIKETIGAPTQGGVASTGGNVVREAREAAQREANNDDT